MIWECSFLSRNKMKYFVALLCSFLLSCSVKKEELVAYRMDMDNHIFWEDPTPRNIISDPAAYSGRFVCRLDSLFQYSPTFQARLSSISKRTVSSVILSGWFKRENNFAQPQLVIEIKNGDGVTMEWLMKGFEGRTSDTMRWTYLESEIDLIEKSRNRPDNIYRIYVMNTKGAFTLLDDFQIVFY